MSITSPKERSTTFLVGSQITNGYPRPTFRRILLARSSDSQTRKTHSRAENQQSDEHKSYNAITIVHVPPGRHQTRPIAKEQASHKTARSIQVVSSKEEGSKNSFHPDRVRLNEGFGAINFMRTHDASPAGK